VFVDAITLEPTGDSVAAVGGTAVGLAFSPDGLRLAAVLENNLVRIVDVAARSLENRYLESVDVPFFAVAWAPRGDRIATGTAGGTVQLWDAVTLQPAAPAGRQSPIPVRGLAFSPDGVTLASTTEFATSRLWNAVTGAPIGADLVAGAAPITIAAIPEPERPEIPFVPSFSPNGLVLFTGSDHPMIWSLDPADWRSAACAIAGRELTPNEWARYLPGYDVRSTCTH
jgi:WD40 repeat protein